MAKMPVSLFIPAGLRSQRLVAEPNRLFPNIDPLPRSVLDRWYRSQESKEWDQLEAAATKAQSIPRFEE